jgi:hypothetical protein
LLKVWVVGEDLFLRRSSREHFQNVFDPDSHVANARTATTLTGFDRDSRLKECVCHVGDIQSRWAVQLFAELANEVGQASAFVPPGIVQRGADGCSVVC